MNSLIIDNMCKEYFNYICFRLNLDPAKNPYLPKDKKDALPEHMRIVVL